MYDNNMCCNIQLLEYTEEHNAYNMVMEETDRSCAKVTSYFFSQTDNLAMSDVFETITEVFMTNVNLRMIKDEADDYTILIRGGQIEETHYEGGELKTRVYTYIFKDIADFVNEFIKDRQEMIMQVYYREPLF
jgi:hypothetical protein